jgi:transcriptional regulator with XRE-family HTH domain
MRGETRRGVGNFDGRRLERARALRGMTTRELAGEIGVTVTVLGQYEQGERVPERNTLDRLAAALGCAVKDLCAPARVTLRDLRERVGTTQEEVSTRVGLTRSTYAMLEQGRIKSMLPHVAAALAPLFGVDRSTIESVHAEAVASRAAVPAPLVLEGPLLEDLARHFDMEPEELLDLARRLATERGESE